MSVLKVATIQDLSSANSSTPEQVAQGRAKAWVNFNGTGTVAISDGYNVTSITDHGTGDYTVNYTSTLSNANYAYAALAASTSLGGPVGVRHQQTKTTSSMRLLFTNATPTAVDVESINVLIFGD